MSDGGPAFVEIDPPIKSDHVAAGGADMLQYAGGAGAEIDHRHAGRNRIDDHFSVGLNKLFDSRTGVKQPAQLSKICTTCAPAAIWQFKYSPITLASRSIKRFQASGAL